MNAEVTLHDRDLYLVASVKLSSIYSRLTYSYVCLRLLTELRAEPFSADEKEVSLQVFDGFFGISQ